MESEHVSSVLYSEKVGNRCPVAHSTVSVFLFVAKPSSLGARPPKPGRAASSSPHFLHSDFSLTVADGPYSCQKSGGKAGRCGVSPVHRESAYDTFDTLRSVSRRTLQRLDLPQEARNSRRSSWESKPDSALHSPCFSRGPQRSSH